jgi:hypothetical protein
MKNVLFSIFLYALVFSIAGQPIITIKGEEQTPISAPYLYYKLSNLPLNKWALIKTENIEPLNFFEGKIIFRTQTNKSLVFEWADNKIEKMRCYIINKKGDTCNQVVYDDKFGYKNALYIKNKIIILHSPNPEEVYTLYYSVYSHNPLYIVPWARNIDAFMVRFIKEYTWYGMFSGMILIIFSLNILFFILLKEKTFFWYASYALSLGLFHWSYIGVGFQWLWPHFSVWNQYSYMFTSFMMLGAQFIYLKYYAKNINELKNRYINLGVFIRAIILVYSVINNTVIEWYLLLDFLSFLYLLYLLIKIKLYQSLHGKIYITSIAILIISYLIFISAYYNLIETTTFAYNSVSVGGSLELLIGLLALALRFKYLSDEKEHLQKSEISSLKKITDLNIKLIKETKEKERIQIEINKELEVKIKERTIELEDKNTELVLLNQKLNEISSMLDKQNWALNQELNSNQTKLMWGKNITYNEFLISFPSEKHVIRFIADLKWKDGYTCKKCHSNNYIEGAQYFSRKCNLCKYEESVTANTLFHGVKFSMLKALYISLVTVIKRENISVKQIAEEIELREATVWAFRKKTLDRINDRANQSGDILNCLVN